MRRTAIPWSQVRTIWWAAAWRAALVGYGITPVLGFVLVLIVEPRLGGSATMALLAPFAVIWQLAITVWALWFALSKEYRGFRIVIAAR